MKLERAKELEKVVKQRTSELNAALAIAAGEGLIITATLSENFQVGRSETPFITTEVKVKIEDVEG